MTQKVDATNWKLIASAWTPIILYMAFIFALSAQSELPAPAIIEIPDKLLHYGIYLVYGIITVRGMLMLSSKETAMPYIQALFLCAIYGATDEFHQKFVSHRSPDIRDWMADILGISTGLLIVLIYRKLQARKGGITDDRI